MISVSCGSHQCANLSLGGGKNEIFLFLTFFFLSLCTVAGRGVVSATHSV